MRNHIDDIVYVCLIIQNRISGCAHTTVQVARSRGITNATLTLGHSAQLQEAHAEVVRTKFAAYARPHALSLAVQGQVRMSVIICQFGLLITILSVRCFFCAFLCLFLEICFMHAYEPHLSRQSFLPTCRRVHRVVLPHSALHCLRPTI